MAQFCFIRHGQMSTAEGGTAFYRGFAWNMQTLSPLGCRQLEEAARDPRLQGADLIIASPYGRTMHSAAILSRALDLEILVETGLHEWVADCETYDYLSDDEARAAYRLLTEHGGHHPEGQHCRWESAEQMTARVTKVLDKYAHLNKVIVVCHGTLMQYVLGIPHPDNGQIHVMDYPG